MSAPADPDHGPLANQEAKLIAEIEALRDEVRRTWRAARITGSQMEAFRIFERMTDRIGYGRTENNPSLAGGPDA